MDKSSAEQGSCAGRHTPHSQSTGMAGLERVRSSRARARALSQLRWRRQQPKRTRTQPRTPVSTVGYALGSRAPPSGDAWRLGSRAFGLEGDASIISLVHACHNRSICLPACARWCEYKTVGAVLVRVHSHRNRQRRGEWVGARQWMRV
eukprot:scaffold3826_cov407-Prasinococcus_capsulatus_cf.AAC.14